MLFRRSTLRLASLCTHVSTQRFASTKTLKETLQEVIPAKQEQLKSLKAKHSQKVIGDVKVENIIGVPALKRLLPAAPGGKEIIAESMLWLLLTGKVPTEAETRQLSRELAEKGDLPTYVEKLIDGLSPSIHPMTQLGIGVAALNHDSEFQKAYESGIKKTEYWTHTLEDCLTLIARLPALAARIYRNIYRQGAEAPAIDKDLDLVGNYTALMGYGANKDLTEYLRLYISIHGDHEGGNASAHTAHLVGSTLADPYLAYSAALFALAGPLHGLANQEVLRWQLAMLKELGGNITLDNIKDYLWKTLKSGQVVPGYGHGVLRKSDPRFIALQEFCDTRPDLLKSATIQLVKKTYQVAPGVLTEHGKTKNPWPNVDAASGCVLYHYGLTEFKYYTVIFGVSRALGALTQLVWARALGLPLERPKSVSMDTLQDMISKGA
ncbi:citrate synthase [Lactarius akahatsu]|uniref:Citrate synthase n=1 Tax=Lactarius akahatsu TaxID=416441 RepID=A0AAD4LRQ9_9AGAM|nr:citrate synthase [Lactarius akahatsu]